MYILSLCIQYIYSVCIYSTVVQVKLTKHNYLFTYSNYLNREKSSPECLHVFLYFCSDMYSPL